MKNKLVVVIMGQNCERTIEMAIESVKNADAVVYCDGGSKDASVQLALGNDVEVIHNEYNQTDKKMNGRQRNFYLKHIKNKYPNWWCLAIDADEVVEDISKIMEGINEMPPGIYSVRMRHFIQDLSHEDATVEKHFVPNRLFKIEKAGFYPEVEHPVLQEMEFGTIMSATSRTTIWHLAYIPNLWEIKKRYEGHLSKSEMHTPQFLKQWYLDHLFGDYPKKRFPLIEIPPIILKAFGIDPGEIYFLSHRTLELKHFLMTNQWLEHFKPKDVLEWGCGVGLYGYAIKMFGVPYYGIEIERWAVENNLHLTTVAQGDIRSTKTDRRDLVLVIDVLEHLEEKDLETALENIRESGNSFIFSVPYDNDPNFKLDPTHKIEKPKRWWVSKLSKFFVIKDVPKDWFFAPQLLMGVPK